MLITGRRSLTNRSALDLDLVLVLNLLTLIFLPLSSMLCIGIPVFCNNLIPLPLFGRMKPGCVPITLRFATRQPPLLFGLSLRVRFGNRLDIS